MTSRVDRALQNSHLAAWYETHQEASHTRILSAIPHRTPHPKPYYHNKCHVTICTNRARTSTSSGNRGAIFCDPCHRHIVDAMRLHDPEAYTEYLSIGRGETHPTKEAIA